MNLNPFTRKTESRSDPALSFALTLGLVLGRVVVLVERISARLRAFVPALLFGSGCVALVVGAHKFSVAAAWVAGGVLAIAVGLLLAYARGSR